LSEVITESLPVVVSDASADDVLTSLKKDVRLAIEKSRRIETAAEILIDAKENLKKFEN
jgi:hypothetical protein